jgi:hypothetical protein
VFYRCNVSASGAKFKSAFQVSLCEMDSNLAFAYLFRLFDTRVQQKVVSLRLNAISEMLSIPRDRRNTVSQVNAANRATSKM